MISRLMHQCHNDLHFFAYEIGYAHGKEIKTWMEQLLPNISHLQCIDLSRHQVLMTWYTAQELLMFFTMKLIEQVHWKAH